MIDRFRGEYAFLSNFYAAPTTVDGCTYPTSEHAYQALKTNDLSKREEIRALPTPGKAKRAGQTLGRLQRHNWYDIRIDIMEEVLRAKFEAEELRAKLLATGDETIIEGNDHNDSFWGCTKDIADNWDGQNWLGELLMKLRKEFRGEG